MRMVGFRKNWRSGLVVVLVLGAIGMILCASRSKEPSYQSRTLGAWLKDIENSRDDREAEPARAAVRKIGTNAMPSLLKLMRAEDSRWKETLIILLGKQHIFRIQVADA